MPPLFLPPSYHNIQDTKRLIGMNHALCDAFQLSAEFAEEEKTNQNSSNFSPYINNEAPSSKRKPKFSIREHLRQHISFKPQYLQ